jgi:hypothetical protein
MTHGDMAVNSSEQVPGQQTGDSSLAEEDRDSGDGYDSPGRGDTTGENEPRR